MPLKPKSYNATRTAENRKAYELHRGSARQRGYTHAWDEYAKAYKLEHPLCVRCKANGKYVPAEVVDHIKPAKRFPELFWEPDNHQSLCAICNAAKGKDDAIISSGVTRFVVCGPPGVGKTTYVDSRREIGDFVWDLDAVTEVVYGEARIRLSKDQLRVLTGMLAKALDILATTTITTWIIICDLNWANEISKKLCARLIVLDGRHAVGGCPQSREG